MPTAAFSPARVLNIFPFALGGSLFGGSPQGTYLSLNAPLAFTGDLLHFQFNNQSLWTLAPTGLVTHTLVDSAVNVVNPVLILGHRSDGTAANGFGAGVRVQLQTSNGTSQIGGEWQVAWSNATTGARRGQMLFKVGNASGTLTALQLGTDGSVPLFGALGVAPASQQSGGVATAGSSYTATEQDMLQRCYDCLRIFGYLS